MKLNQVDSYRRMRTATDFSDVTLVCEDSRQIYAHRVILASSSSFFQNVLTKVMHSHPLIFLRGVPHSQLSAIVDFIYLGQAEIRQEDVEAFVKLAVELGVKGLEIRDKGTEGGKDGEKSNEKQATKDPITAAEKLIVEEESDGGPTSSSMTVEGNVLAETPHVDEASLLTEEPLKLAAFKCDECGRTYGSKPSLSTHKSFHHRKMELKSSEGRKGKQTLEAKKDGKRSVSEQNVKKPKQILGAKDGKRGASHSQQNGRKGKGGGGGKRGAKGGKRGAKGGKKGAMGEQNGNIVVEAENENIPSETEEGHLETEVGSIIETSGYNGSAASSEGDTGEGQGSLVKDSLFMGLDRSE